MQRKGFREARLYGRYFKLQRFFAIQGRESVIENKLRKLHGKTEVDSKAAD